ncbi:outer membrane beta-barrel protein [Parabacteroides sp. Marseille-P3160]|uniref:outer membrane beta-barrel protein n=1 Tax=Parabacteroides sp. Marseille-P3160 TaxID=1917887 RepID=UPI0009B9E23D|nr:outer membrane beta-barrel protein [Parabacteroides sp. Marseille-P3160]
MKTTYPIILFIACWMTIPYMKAQEQSSEKREYHLLVGLNIGGTTPIPLPREIRKINSYQPGLQPVLALRATHWLGSYPGWGITSGLYIDYKGFEEESEVKYWYTNLQVGEGEAAGTYSGTFSGKNKSKVKNGYFTIPLMASYRPFDGWTFHLGGYFSWMHTSKFEGTASDGYIRNGGPNGSKTIIESATFDFSDKEKDIDAGLLAAADWNFYRRLSLTCQLNYGLIPVFPSDFKGVSYSMYNIYFTIGFSYKL